MGQIAIWSQAASSATFRPSIPRTWDDAEMQDLELPLARPEYSLRQIKADYYYRIPIRPIYKTYPVYSVDRQPAGYLDWLKQQEPKVVFDPGQLRTQQDWVRAGELVFDAPVSFEEPLAMADVQQADFVSKTGVSVLTDGTVPFLRYVVRKKGQLELGSFACGMCHTRVMPDGSIIKAAQGNFPGDRVIAFNMRRRAQQDPEGLRKILLQTSRSLLEVPWAKPDPIHDRLFRMPFDEHLSVFEAVPPGVFTRHRSSVFFPPQLPDLIGVKDRLYLDKSGLQRHRRIVDMMRYAALNQGADDLGDYKGFIPAAEDLHTPLDPATQERYSDEQLYALSLYLYSAQPPTNPNKVDAISKRGEQVFEAEGCGTCHTRPLYTNNKLIPVAGFKVPPEHLKKYDILNVPIGTDPTLSMETRRGTGYYKVPSLKGVWYRGPFEHNGSVATLEDWFDPSRLRDDYVPSGFKGYGVKMRAVKGHEFGLKLPADNRRALIAFLKTL
jgi:hypothetical protein